MRAMSLRRRSFQNPSDFSTAPSSSAPQPMIDIISGMIRKPPFPDDPWDQLRGAVAAVFRSWDSPRAVAYRRSAGLREDGGLLLIPASGTPLTAAAVRELIDADRHGR